MTDFRALCAELVEDIEEWMGATEHNAPSSVALVNRARAALAAQVPEGAMIPDQYKGYQVHVYRAGFHAGYTHGLTRANAAPAQPKPQGPTDEDLIELIFNENDWNYISPETFLDIARSVLELK